MRLEQFVDKLRYVFPADAVFFANGDVVLRLTWKMLLADGIPEMMPWVNFLALKMAQELIATVERFDEIDGSMKVRFRLQPNVQLLLW